VANKASDYGQTDILQLTLLMESIWKVVERQQAVDDLKRSEERYKRLTENVEDIIYRYEFFPERRLTYISPSSTRITGFSPEEFYADPDLLRRLVHPDDRTFFEGLSEGKTAVQPIILRWVKKGDLVIWTEQRNVQIFDENGILIAIEGIARDITERKRMEEALTKEHERLSLIIKGANAGSWDWSVQTGDLIVDERWAEIAGYTLDELRPVSVATWDRLIHPDDVKVFEKALERHFRGKRNTTSAR
jgi:PAS domain S-box-containing protein